MIRQQRVYIKGTYTPKKINHWRRDNHEALFRKLALEANKTPFNGDIGYMSDYELLCGINILLQRLSLQTYTTEELQRPLSLKN